MEVSEGCQDVYFPSFLSARLQEVAVAIFLTKALVPTVGSSPTEKGTRISVPFTIRSI